MQNQVPVSQNRPVTGRFAPSPSGRLHLGNLACSLLAWLSAKSQGGRIVLRIEDLDAERCPRVYADLLEQDLAWLGLTWDEGGSTGGAHAPYYQSECGDIYTQSYRKLEQMGLVYPCFCSRSQLHAASAPHTSDGNVIYPGTCRGLTPEEIAEKRKKKAPAYRPCGHHPPPPPADRQTPRLPGADRSRRNPGADSPCGCPCSRP